MEVARVLRVSEGLTQAESFSLRGGILVPIGNFLEVSSQRILVGIILVGRLGAWSSDPIRVWAGPPAKWPIPIVGVGFDNKKDDANKKEGGLSHAFQSPTPPNTSPRVRGGEGTDD